VAWDSSRPVPWLRLMREWLLYVAIMAVIFIVLYRDRLSAGPFVGLLASGPIYLLIGGVLAKFGYQRKRLKDIRAESAARRSEVAASTAATARRQKPPPTRRTAGGNRPSTKPRRR
jgi:uncharacterized membrane protein